MCGSFDISPDRVLMGKTKDGLCRAVVNSKEIGDYLTQTFGRFRTAKFEDGSLPDVRLPITYLEKCDGIREFLSAAFSCDGGVSFYPVIVRKDSSKGYREVMWFNRNVFLSCKHPILLNDYSYLLSLLGIKGSILIDRIKISSRVQMSNFQKEVGFIKGVEVTSHSKLWGGLDKSILLERALSSYANQR